MRNPSTALVACVLLASIGCSDTVVLAAVDDSETHLDANDEHESMQQREDASERQDGEVVRDGAIDER